MMHNRASFLARAALAACLALGTAAPALASSSGNGSGNGGSVSLGSGSSQQGHVSDQKLRKFGAAYMQLRSIRVQFVKKLKNADGKKERTQLKKAGQKKMIQAIRSQDLKVAEYQQIGRKLNGDKALRKRLRKILQQEKKGAASDS